MHHRQRREHHRISRHPADLCAQPQSLGQLRQVKFGRTSALREQTPEPMLQESLNGFRSQRRLSGDLVQLKGGGPRMTVSFYTVGGQVQCKWFVGETLTKAERVQETLDYFTDHGFSLHVQWLNPGYRDHGPIADDLNLVDTILNTRRSSVSIRDGRQAAEGRRMARFVVPFLSYTFAEPTARFIGFGRFDRGREVRI